MSVMYVSYVVLAVLAAAANTCAAATDFLRTSTAVAKANMVEVPLSWLYPLGALKAAGALGLLVGIAVPAVGVAAATGLILFFVCAIFAHLRVRWYATIPFPAALLLGATGALLSRLASM